jgi:uncharacterized phage protein (TIGR02218 family)
MAARIASGAAKLCHVWLVTRSDGLRFGFTDHDEPLEVSGVPCSAASGWTAGAAQADLGLQPGSGAIAGALSHGAVTDEELEAGVWDAAAVDLRRVDWERPDLFVSLWKGRIARVTRSGGGFSAEVEGPLALLDRVAGRTYERSCDAVFGDARCRADTDLHPGAVCDKRFETCRDRFGNSANYRGFPDIPGDDFLLLTPGEGGRHDGRSRR